MTSSPPILYEGRASSKIFMAIRDNFWFNNLYGYNKYGLEHFKILCSGLGRCEDKAGKEEYAVILKYHE